MLRTHALPEEAVQPGEGKASGGPSCYYQPLNGGCRDVGVRLFSYVLSGRTRDNRHELEHGKLQLGTREKNCTLRIVKC